jgi:ligand-binding sensor domain-containing protein
MLCPAILQEWGRDDANNNAATGTLLAAMGCGSSSTAPTTSTLTVTITAPTGVMPSVTVSGPGGYTKALTATTTLSGLTAGSYTVAAASVTITAPIVGTLFTATLSGSPATVTGGGTAAATVTYTQAPGSGGLWIANYDFGNGTVVQYTAAQLASITSAAAATVIGAGGISNKAVAFDANGSLWMTTENPGGVQEYTATQLKASSAPTPAVTLPAPTYTLGGLAFDASGNLWVANPLGNTVFEYAASQLLVSVSPTPNIVLSASSGSLNAPYVLAFDASGNLWVANAGSNTVVEFATSQLAASGAPTPTVTMTSSAKSIN